jgi:hypothetical protein
MEGISVLSSNLPECVKATTVIKNSKNYCIILNDNYDEKIQKEILKEEIRKIKLLIKSE